MKIIAKIYTDFKEKFGIPRQSGLVRGTVGRIVFEPKYRRPEALRGIEGYSHLWLIWSFTLAEREEWSPTVRPPRLGGNKRMGVFATRSPFRPNPIGLSSVRLIGVEESEGEGVVLLVEGADILDGTPIFDIKPYLAFTDSHPDAVGGFADGALEDDREVLIPERFVDELGEDAETVRALLEQDPRPHYRPDDDREYAMVYGEREIFFRADGGKIILTRLRTIPTKRS